jgi:hypothetical protein
MPGGNDRYDTPHSHHPENLKSQASMSVFQFYYKFYADSALTTYHSVLDKQTPHQ